jgi:integrase/recombinase XerD
VNIKTAINQYLQLKRRSGAAYINLENQLGSFARITGNISLEEVSKKQVESYLAGHETSPYEWNRKYRMIKRFFAFCEARKYLATAPMPKPRPSVRTTFAPYIYSIEQIRALLRATSHLQEIPIRSTVDPRTLRMFLLFIYGSGATPGEALKLRIMDVDFRTGTLLIRSEDKTKSRRIPLCKDLTSALNIYLRWRIKVGSQSDRLFVKKDGHALRKPGVDDMFRRLRVIAKVSGPGGPRKQPHMHDLRHSFAVHRITSWIRAGADLDRLLPALSAYMGYMGLTATERHLQMTPERLRKPLSKLSPKRPRGRWRNDKELIKALTAL